MKGITIQAKIIIFSCSLLLSVVILQIFFSIFLSKTYYTNLKKSQVETLFLNLKNNYSDDEEIIQGITQYAVNAYNINVQIFSDSGVIYGNLIFNFTRTRSNSSGRNTEALSQQRNLRYSPEPKAEIQKMPELPRMANRPNMPNFPRLNNENIILTGRFEYQGDNRYVRITTPVESIDASVAAIARVNTAIAAFVLIIGIAGSVIFAKNFSGSIQSIKEAAKDISLLNFNIRADENVTTLELRDLSGSINTMSDKLKSLILDLKISNDKLQADVDNQKRLDKMRREFVANVSHELKSPLHLLLMYTENLKNNVNGIDKDYYCNTIIEETNRLNDMVKSLLDLSAIENGLSKMKKEKINFSEFTEYILSKMALLFENLTINISVEKEIFIEGDIRYIEQAIKNYILNAVSHTADNGRISVELKHHDNKAVFSVFNQGSLIADEDISQIWESFYRADKARARDENHSGLGLYVVKTIIQAHTGAYGVQNKEDGVEFWFALAETAG